MNETSEEKPGQNGLLSGVRLLLTRPEIKLDSLQTELRKHGAEVVSHPLIEYSEPSDMDLVREVGRRINEYGMLVFLSRHAVSRADQYFLSDATAVPPIAAIGSGTQDCLKVCGHEVSIVPAESNSESMAEVLIEQFRTNANEKPILILRADRGSDVLPIALKEAGIPFKELAVYQSRDVSEADPLILQQLSEGRFDWLTVTSSSIASNAVKLFGEQLAGTKIASISPTTSRVVTDAGLTVTAEATGYNFDGLVKAIVEHHLSN
jgi:uroporphyrinogen-III synthase